MLAVSETYQFRIEGELSADLVASFDPIWTGFEYGCTVFSCVIRDRPAMFGLIARCEMLGLHLVAVQRMAWPQ